VRPISALQSLLRKLLPKSHYPFFDRYEEQAVLIVETIFFLAGLAAKDGVIIKAAALKAQAKEGECDRLTGEILVQLGNEFIVPMDREDMAKLAKLNDTIMDLVEEAAVKMADYSLRVDADILNLLDILRACAAELRNAYTHLRTFDPQFYDVEKAVKALEHRADVIERKIIKESYESDILAILKDDKLSCAFGDTPTDLKIGLLKGRVVELFLEHNRRRKRREVGEILEEAVDTAREVVMTIGDVYLKYS